MFRYFLFSFLTFLLFSNPLFASALEESNEFEEINFDDITINTSHLVPSRLIILPNNEILDKLFENPQVYISLERTHRYLENFESKQAIRIRWIANTHTGTDEAIVETERFSIIEHTAIGGDYRRPAKNVLFLENDQVIETRLERDGSSKKEVIEANGNSHYHIIILPFLLASIDAPEKTFFTLPTYSNGTNTFDKITVKSIGPVVTEDKNGNTFDAWQYQSDHGWVEITWYIDKQNAPYLRKMNWDYKAGAFAGKSSLQFSPSFEIFEDDLFTDIVK